MASLLSKSLLLASCISSALGAVTPQTLKKSNTLPGGYIVEWEGDSLVDVRSLNTHIFGPS